VVTPAPIRGDTTTSAVGLFRAWRTSGTVIAKKDVDFADSVAFNGQDPVSRCGKAIRCGASEMQSAQAISAAYDFDLAARDYTLADGAIEAVIEGPPWSVFINPSQSRELIFCG
jgi:hypothetical protein